VKRALVVAALVAAAAPSEAADRCALVVASEPAPDAAALDGVRGELAGRCRFVVEDAAARAALERFERPPSPEERARDALARAHARMRRFDVAGVREALDDARDAVSDGSPLVDDRELMIQLALQQAELGVIEHDAAAQLAAMRIALAVDPELQLDAARASPPMVALLLRARDQLKRSARVRVSIASQPDGARVWAGAWLGETPLTVELPEGPALVRLVHSGRRGKALQVNVTAGARISATLAPLSDGERLRALVDALRRAPRDARPQPAAALAAALGVETVVVVENGASPAVFAPAAPSPPPPPRPAAPAPAAAAAPRLVATPIAPPPPWYKRKWPWALIVGGAVVVVTAVTVGVVVGAPQPAGITCCR
jgi:hypothetical protein